MTLEASLAVADGGPPVPTFQNIVATVNLNCKVDLRNIALRARNIEYNPKRFHAAILRIRDPKSTALVFSSGKMVITGAKSKVSCEKAAKIFIRIIMKTGDYPELMKRQLGDFGFKVQNLVASCDLKFPIRLETLAYTETLGLATYEAEIFPGLIYRVLKPKVVLLIFASGKVVITGAKVQEDTFKAWELMYPLIIQHRRFVNSEPSSSAPTSTVPTSV